MRKYLAVNPAKQLQSRNLFLVSLFILSFFIFVHILNEVFPIEKILFPHRYYIKKFVDSLPHEVQLKMKNDAAEQGIDIYEYNMKMCGEDLSYLEWLRI